MASTNNGGYLQRLNSQPCILGLDDDHDDMWGIIEYTLYDLANEDLFMVKPGGCVENLSVPTYPILPILAPGPSPTLYGVLTVFGEPMIPPPILLYAPVD